MPNLSSAYLSSVTPAHTPDVMFKMVCYVALPLVVRLVLLRVPIPHLQATKIEGIKTNL